MTPPERNVQQVIFHVCNMRLFCLFMYWYKWKCVLLENNIFSILAAIACYSCFFVLSVLYTGVIASPDTKYSNGTLNKSTKAANTDEFRVFSDTFIYRNYILD